MGARRTDMHRLQEMVRLCRMGRSARAIARALHMGRNTIQGYLAAFAADGLLEGAADELPAIEALRACVRAHVPQPPLPQQTSSLERWIEKIRASSR